jgi:hypothetical protein
MRYLMPLCLSVVLVSVVEAQSSVTRRRVITVGSAQSVAALSEENRPKQTKRETTLFGAGALGFFPSKDGGFDVSTEALSFQVYGPAKKVEEDDSVHYEETVAFELYVDSYVVDALVANAQAVKEYLVSKKGSPISARIPLSFTYWNTRKGDVKQFWSGGEAYGSLRAVPLGEQGFEKIGGALNLGYTQTINIDFSGQGKAGNVFIEATANGALPFGSGMSAAVFGASSDQKVTAGLDYRVGVTFGGTRALTIVGTYAFTEVAAKRSTVRLAFSGGK